MSWTIVLGTGNLKKRQELEALLSGLDIELLTLKDFPNAIEVIEDGLTFAENARKKAAEQAKHLNQWVLAEDSGLTVDILKTEPGVYSARFAALKQMQRENGWATLSEAAKAHPEVHSTDADNNRMLLDVLKDVSADERAARYNCFMALSNPQGEIVAETNGYCCGRILDQPHGTNGFGYDPYFEIVELHQTFGLLSPAVKSCISHRARAARQLIPILQRLRRSFL